MLGYHDHYYHKYHIWLVVWNMNFIFPFSWECHHPNGLSLIFFRGVAQPAAKYDYHNQYHHPYHIRSPQHITNFHMVIYNLYIIYLYNIHIQSGVYIIYIYTYIYIYIHIWLMIPTSGRRSSSRIHVDQASARRQQLDRDLAHIRLET